MTTDPYKVLGVSPNADDEEIKKAYHALVRKYHPDRYNNSDLAELAGEKMREVNAAYEEIQKRRAAGEREQPRQDNSSAGGFLTASQACPYSPSLRWCSAPA